MSNYKRQLFCTFSDVKSYQGLYSRIKDFYIIQSKIFVFGNEKIPSEIYLTYNASIDNSKKADRFPQTISIHRKKDTNTLYTLNSMNKLIEEENGKFDTSYILNWKLYQNCLILSNDVCIKVVPLKIIDII